MANASTGSTGIEITGKISIFFLFYFFLFKPVVEIDGSPAGSGKWNSPTFFPAAPGTHQVEAYYKLYFFLPVNRATMSVSVPDGGVVKLDYKPSIWGMLGKGKLTAA